MEILLYISVTLSIVLGNYISVTLSIFLGYSKSFCSTSLYNDFALKILRVLTNNNGNYMTEEIGGQIKFVSHYSMNVNSTQSILTVTHWV